MRLESKVVLVTGAGRGIGKGLARDIAREGAGVAVHYLCEKESADTTCREIRACGGDAAPFQADLSTSSGRSALFEQVFSHFGRLDVLINNAGLDPGLLPFLDTTEEQFDRVMGVNLKGAYFCAQAAARQMIRQGSGGRIINISSIHAQKTEPHRSAYAASKGGLDTLTRALALDLAPYGINVNTIAPGFIEVERTIRVTPDYDRDAIGQRIPGRRVGFPSDISSLAVFLCSSESSYITGQVILIDGGLSAQMAL